MFWTSGNRVGSATGLEVQLCNIRALSAIIKSVYCPSWSACYFFPYLAHMFSSFLRIWCSMFCNVLCMHAFSIHFICNSLACEEECTGIPACSREMEFLVLTM